MIIRHLLGKLITHSGLRQGCLVGLLALGAAVARAERAGAPVTESIVRDQQGMDSYVYAPDPIRSEITYQLVVGVHGVGGNGAGAAGLKDWAKRGDVIVIGPSFVAKGDDAYQMGDGVHAQKLIALFKGLKKKYKLRERMFLHGFSGGSQFVHRFAMLHPEQVCGVSAHSGGTWATDNYGRINTAAKAIPFAISCGENDTQKSFGHAPYTRLEWLERFRDEIDQKGFVYISSTWEGVGHSVSPGAWDMAKQCFQLGTGLPGNSATEEIAIRAEWKNLKTIKKPAPVTNSARRSQPAPTVTDPEFERMIPVAFKRADEEQVPDDRLIAFMKKHPPILWKDRPGSTKLVEQCTRAANLWSAAAITNGAWSGTQKNEFLRFTEGLEIKTPDSQP